MSIQGSHSHQICNAQQIELVLLELSRLASTQAVMFLPLSTMKPMTLLALNTLTLCPYRVVLRRGFVHLDFSRRSACEMIGIRFVFCEREGYAIEMVKEKSEGQRWRGRACNLSNSLCEEIWDNSCDLSNSLCHTTIGAHHLRFRKMRLSVCLSV
mmetsp:Transcript_8305/g.30651  ORF Transcript_8305/g.30651 Transcript_8305/m.30651 type:complete len:155 (+) Transcript_8305:692-1156(+)